MYRLGGNQTPRTPWPRSPSEPSGELSLNLLPRHCGDSSSDSNEATRQFTTAMSDPTAEPGAPTTGSTNIPSASEKSISNAAQKRAPKLTSLAAQPDRIILRVNKYVIALINSIEASALTRRKASGKPRRLECIPLHHQLYPLHPHLSGVQVRSAASASRPAPEA